MLIVFLKRSTHHASYIYIRHFFNIFFLGTKIHASEQRFGRRFYRVSVGIEILGLHQRKCLRCRSALGNQAKDRRLKKKETIMEGYSKENKIDNLKQTTQAFEK